jgi:hypothetical protein
MHKVRLPLGTRYDEDFGGSPSMRRGPIVSISEKDGNDFGGSPSMRRGTVEEMT